jgi:hypothetical protein
LIAALLLVAAGVVVMGTQLGDRLVGEAHSHGVGIGLVVAGIIVLALLGPSFAP